MAAQTFDDNGYTLDGFQHALCYSVSHFLKPTIAPLALALWLIAACCKVAIANQPVTIGVFPNHQQVLQSSSAYGLSWALFSRASRQKKLLLKTIESPWTAVEARIKAQKLAFAFGAVKTQKREQWAEFSLPLGPVYIYTYTRQENPLNDLTAIDRSRSAVGVVKGSVYEAIANRLNFSSVYKATDDVELFRLILNYRLDYVILAKSMSDYACRAQERTSCLKPIGNPLLTGHAHVLASHENAYATQALSTINRALVQQANTEATRQLFRQFGFSDSQYRAWLSLVKPTATD